MNTIILISQPSFFQEPLGDEDVTTPLKFLKKDKKSGTFTPIGRDKLLYNLIAHEPLFMPDSFKPSIIKRINPKDFEPDGSLSSVFYPVTHVRNSRNCSKPPSPPNGSWRCQEDGQECSLLCKEGFMARKSVSIKYIS